MGGGTYNERREGQKRHDGLPSVTFARDNRLLSADRKEKRKGGRFPKTRGPPNDGLSPWFHANPYVSVQALMPEARAPVKVCAAEDESGKLRG